MESADLDVSPHFLLFNRLSWDQGWDQNVWRTFREVKLSAAKVKAETRPGRHGDGNGLYLYVRPDGRKSWVLRYRLGTKQKDMGLGSYPAVSLAQARFAVVEARERLRSGVDPMAARKAEKLAAAQRADEASKRTFEAIAGSYIERHEATWRNAKHRQQWANTLTTYAYPKIGQVHVADVTRAQVLDVLEAVWERAPETASRLRGRIETILDYAASKGWRTSENPARWRDLRHELPDPKKLKPQRNQAALPWAQVPAFLAEVRKHHATAARALELVILTAARTSEVLGTRWREIDLDGATWTVPAARMKAAKVHRVPLSSAAMAVLQGMKPLATKSTSHVFPGNRKDSALSQMALLMLLRRMQGQGDDPDADAPPRWADQEGRAITVHGFRASFRTWAGDMTGHPREVIEAALAHQIKDKAEASYVRGDLLERRRALMADWAAFVMGNSADRRA